MWTGPSRPKLVVVAQNLVNEQQPFDSIGGSIFKTSLMKAGIPVEKVGFTWSHPGTAIEIRDRGATFVILAGEGAVALWRPDLHVRQCHGRMMALDDECFGFPTFHPEAFARNPRWRSLLCKELQILREIASDPESWISRSPLTCVRCRGEFYRVDDMGVVYCERHWGAPDDRPVTVSQFAAAFGAIIERGTTTPLT
jgi:hypothetical protein